jgi:hypothetical protein
MERSDASNGFSVAELLAVIAVLGLLVAVLFPAMAHKIMAADMTPFAVRAKEIFMAIAVANMEREPLGLPPVWPADGGAFDFTNSTDYFRVLCDEEIFGGRDERSGRGWFDHGNLSDPGVKRTGEPLAAAQNMWTIAKNVREEWDDAVPLLVTRNVDAASLAAKVAGRERGRRVFFDDEWMRPFGDRGFVIVRKGGAIAKFRAKYADYSHVYVGRDFDTSLDQNGNPAGRPLKYLTPMREVTPGDAAYAGSLARQTEKGRTVRRMVRRAEHEWGFACERAVPVSGLCAAAYLFGALAFGLRRRGRGGPPFLSKRLAVAGVASCCAVILYSLFAAAWLWLGGVPWSTLALAVVAQGAGMALTQAVYRGDDTARRCGMKWMLAAPVIAAAVWLCTGVAVCAYRFFAMWLEI